MTENDTILRLAQILQEKVEELQEMTVERDELSYHLRVTNGYLAASTPDGTASVSEGQWCDYLSDEDRRARHVQEVRVLLDPESPEGKPLMEVLDCDERHLGIEGGE